MSILFIIEFLVFSLASVGLGRLYLRLIRPGELLDFIQPHLAKFKASNVFLYKSFGGCDLCTRQRFTELTFLFFAFASPGLSLPEWWLRALVWFVLFMLFGGLAFYFESLVMVNYHSETHRVVKSKIDLNDNPN